MMVMIAVALPAVIFTSMPAAATLRFVIPVWRRPVYPARVDGIASHGACQAGIAGCVGVACRRLFLVTTVVAIGVTINSLVALLLLVPLSGLLFGTRGVWCARLRLYC